MNQQFSLSSPELDIALCAITEADLENLRQWKNANRFSFFFQEIIAPEQQTRWFDGYLHRPDDYMFIIITHASQALGCMGFRFAEGVVDVYNVIRGNPGIGERGLMGQALRLMCSFIVSQSSADIIAQVLLSNPAIAWYQKNGFDRHAEHMNYIEMKLNVSRFHPCSWTRSDGAPTLE